MTHPPTDQADHTRRTRDAYDQLARVWSRTTDGGPFNGLLERPALRALIPRPLEGLTVLEAGCGSGAQCEWLLDEGADVVGVDLSPLMVAETQRRCGDRGRFLVADLAGPLPFESESFDGITCSLALHYLDHPFGPPLPTQRDGYFDTELVADRWHKDDVEVTQYFWRRPLSAVVNAFADGGFLVDRVVEAQPSGEALRDFPDALGRVVGVPWFIVYRIVPRPEGVDDHPQSARLAPDAGFRPAIPGSG